MATGLANTLFQGNSQDAMLVKDAYGVSTKETNNSLFDSVKGIYSDSVSGLYANKGSARQLASLVTAAKNGNVSKTDMLDRALSAMGSSLPGLLGTLGGTLKNKIASAAGELIGPEAEKNVNILYGQLGTLVKVANVGDADSLAEFISELTGNSDLVKLINIEAEAAIIGAIASQALAFGIPGLLDDVMEQARSQESRDKAYAYMSTSAINGSDLATINKVIDKIGLAAFLQANPDAINMILSGFFFGTQDTIDTYAAKRLELVTLLVRIDPHWNEYMRNGTYITNLEPYVTASPNAKTLLLMAEPDKTAVMIAANWPPKTAGSVVQDTYEGALVT